MGKKSAAILGAVILFLGVAVVTWRVLNTGEGVTMTLPPIAFPEYTTQKEKVTTTTAGKNNRAMLSFSQACSSFNTTIRETAARANFCRTDADCAVEPHDVCALGCEYLYNKHVDIGSILTAAVTYEDRQCPECPRVCIQHQVQNIVCRNNVCVVKP